MKTKAYNVNPEEPTIVQEPDVTYLISTSRKGVTYSNFSVIMNHGPFSIEDWSNFLHLSERTMQRYKKEKKSFDPIHSEKILEINLLYNRGVEVFGKKENFDQWLSSRSIALGGIPPKDLLDNTFGIHLLNIELTKIEHGILA